MRRACIRTTTLCCLIMATTGCAQREVSHPRDGRTSTPDVLLLDHGVTRDSPLRPPDHHVDGTAILAGDITPVASSFAVVQPGVFLMGSPLGELCREPLHLETQHQVTLTRAFAISRTEVTQQEFETVMGYLPCLTTARPYCIKPARCAQCPVANTAWHEAVAYCNALSEAQKLQRCYSDQGSNKPCNSDGDCGSSTIDEEICIGGVCRLYRADTWQSGKGSIYDCVGYRLPTEAEWEYAYRAGTVTAFYNGPISNCDRDSNADKIGWNKWEAQWMAHPVATKLPNAWGLFDMPGNVQEWVHDWFVEDYGSSAATDPEGPATRPMHIVRGGGWGTTPNGNGATSLRAAYRDALQQKDRFDTAVDVGFRCARSMK